MTKRPEIIAQHICNTDQDLKELLEAIATIQMIAYHRGYAAAQQDALTARCESFDRGYRYAHAQMDDQSLEVLHYIRSSLKQLEQGNCEHSKGYWQKLFGDWASMRVGVPTDAPFSGLEIVEVPAKAAKMLFTLGWQGALETAKRILDGK